MYKFIYGYVFTDMESGKPQREMGLVIVRKSDTVQHSEVCKYAMTMPYKGGFVKSLRKIERSDFFGESVSAGVRTLEEDIPTYHKLMETGSWWKAEFKQASAIYTIGVVLPAGKRPSDTGQLKWVESNHKDYYDQTQAEMETYSYW